MAAITLDFQKPLKYLDDSIVYEPKAKPEDENVPALLNKILATNMSQSQQGGMKAFHWAIDLYKEGKLTLDKVDRDALKKSIQEMQNINILVQGRLIEIIEQAEEAAKKEATVEAE